MKAELTLGEGAALFDLMGEASRDIVLKTGMDGYLRGASRGLDQLGIRMGGMLIGPHIRELAQAPHAAQVAALHDAVLVGREIGRWIEFPAHGIEGGEQWFALQLTPLHDDTGTAYGTLGIMRSIDERRVLEDELLSAAMTDPLTGLANRRSLMSMLEQCTLAQGDYHLALFEIDHYSALTIRHGASCGDRALAAFASLLRTNAGPEHFVAGIGEHRFALLLSGASLEEARQLCRDLAAKWPAIAASSLGNCGNLPLTTSAGLVPLGSSADDAMTRAELTLFLARAKGRNRVEVEGAGWHSRLAGLRH